jgi:hypothetical protein
MLETLKNVSAHAAVAAIFCLLAFATPAHAVDKAPQSVAQLIDELTQIDAQSLGINSAAVYDGFLADTPTGSFNGGVLGVAPQKAAPAMRELVRLGPAALPELLKHLDDTRSTKLAVGNSGKDRARVGVDFFAFSYFSDEYAPRIFHSWTDEERKNAPRPMERSFQGRYTVKVGDVCYVLIGQIVNRRLLAVRYQPSAGLVVNSTIEAPTLVEETRKDWEHTDADALLASLLDDLRGIAKVKHDEQIYYKMEYAFPALARLRFYFPARYNALDGDNLKLKREYERESRKN